MVPGVSILKGLVFWSSGWAHKCRTNWNNVKGNWNSSMWSSQGFEGGDELSAGARVQKPYWVLGAGGRVQEPYWVLGAGCRSSDTVTVFLLSAHCGHLVCMVSPRLAPNTKSPSIVMLIHQNLGLILPRLLLRLEFQDAYKHASGLEIWDLSADRVSP